MKIGDLVKYKHLNEDIGLIIDESTETSEGYGQNIPVFKVLWYGPTSSWYSVQQWDWMRTSALEVINESR
jgi:hypothetical protein